MTGRIRPDPREKREDAERRLERLRHDERFLGASEERARLVEKLERDVRVYRDWERLEWEAPNEGNGWYAGPWEPPRWLHERERTAEEILLRRLTRPAPGEPGIPDLLPPPVRNPYPAWLDGEAWMRVRAAVLEHQRALALGVVERAFKLAKGQTGFAKDLARFRGREAFVAESADRENLEEYAGMCRRVSAFYSGLADGLGAQDAG